MAVKSALYLVIRGREVYHDYVKNHLYCMVELFLLIRGKLFDVDDQEIRSLLFNDWNLSAFIEQFIQAIMPLKEFGGYRKDYQKEIQVQCIS